MRWNSGADRFELMIGDGTSSATVQASSLGAPSLNTWYFVVAWHDSTADTINIQVNNGTVDNTAWSNGTRNADDGLDVGRDGWGGDQYWNGRMDSLSFWKRVLTAQERTDL